MNKGLSKKSWSVPTSPRSPYKIRDELALLVNLDGKKWDKAAQAEFGRALRQSASFEGDVPETPDWVGRARFGTISFWGFAFKNSYDKLQITDAGKQLLTGKREDEVFARQLVKWQYPDVQHNGNEYPASRFRLHPFVVLLRVLKRVERLSKTEIAMFLFTIVNDDDAEEVADEILLYRSKLSKVEHKVPRKEFQREYFRRRMFRFFKGELNSLLGRVEQKTLFEKDFERLRSKNREKVEEFVKSHFDTFHDYADALIRYSRYTELVSLSGEYVPVIEISPKAADKVSAILKSAHEVFPYRDSDWFYQSFYGNPSVVPLPYENPSELTEMIEKRVEENENLFRRLRKVLPPQMIPAAFVAPTTLPEDLEGLKDIEEKLRTEAKELQALLIAYQLKDKKKLLEIVKEFDIIRKGDVVDPPTFLEWNTWRAFASLDVADKVLAHLKFSDDMQPLSPAGGNVPDMEVYYSDYVLVSEVTLKSGATQWKDESEPVPAHVAKIKAANPTKPTICLFLAPKIDARTSNVFYACAFSPDWAGDTVDIVPLTLDQFVGVMLDFTKDGFTPDALHKLLERISSSRQDYEKLPKDRGIACVSALAQVIETWRKCS